MSSKGISHQKVIKGKKKTSESFSSKASKGETVSLRRISELNANNSSSSAIKGTLLTDKQMKKGSSQSQHVGSHGDKGKGIKYLDKQLEKEKKEHANIKDREDSSLHKKIKPKQKGSKNSKIQQKDQDLKDKEKLSSSQNATIQSDMYEQPSYHQQQSLSNNSQARINQQYYIRSNNYLNKSNTDTQSNNISQGQNNSNYIPNSSGIMRNSNITNNNETLNNNSSSYLKNDQKNVFTLNGSGIKSVNNSGYTGTLNNNQSNSSNVNMQLATLDDPNNNNYRLPNHQIEFKKSDSTKNKQVVSNLKGRLNDILSFQPNDQNDIIASNVPVNPFTNNALLRSDNLDIYQNQNLTIDTFQSPFYLPYQQSELLPQGPQQQSIPEIPYNNNNNNLFQSQLCSSTIIPSNPQIQEFNSPSNIKSANNFQSSEKNQQFLQQKSQQKQQQQQQQYQQQYYQQQPQQQQQQQQQQQYQQQLQQQQQPNIPRNSLPQSPGYQPFSTQKSQPPATQPQQFHNSQLQRAPFTNLQQQQQQQSQSPQQFQNYERYNDRFGTHSKLQSLGAKEFSPESFPEDNRRYSENVCPSIQNSKRRLIDNEIQLNELRMLNHANEIQKLQIQIISLEKKLKEKEENELLVQEYHKSQLADLQAVIEVMEKTNKANEQLKKKEEINLQSTHEAQNKYLQAKIKQDQDHFQQQKKIWQDIYKELIEEIGVLKHDLNQYNAELIREENLKNNFGTNKSTQSNQQEQQQLNHKYASFSQ